MLTPVVIPVFGREDVFDTVSLLSRQPYADALAFILIDNGNAPRLSARLAALASERCHIIRFDTNRGGSAAYIAGMALARERHPEARYVWLLDDDAKPDARTLPELLAVMAQLAAEDPQVASLGSTVLDGCEGDRIIECGAMFSPFLTHSTGRLAGRRLTEIGPRIERVDYAAACSLLVNVAAVEACGFWEDVFIHFDDIEWGLRVTRRGWRNYATTRSTVRHPPFDPRKAGAWICYFDARNQYWLASSYGPLHVASAWCKNAVKNLIDFWSGRHRDRIPYRRLAWMDYAAGIRRTRDDVMRHLKGAQS